MKVASKVVNDKIAQVAIEGMNLIIDVCNNTAPEDAKGGSDMRQHVVKICLGLMEKIGDNNARLREKTEEAAFALAYQPAIGPTIVFSSVTSKNTGKKQAQNSVKHIHGKLMLLKKALDAFKVKTINWKDSIQFALTHIQHQAGEIRNAAYSVILELYIQMKKNIMSELESLRPNQMEILTKAFADIDSGNLKKAFSQIGLDYQALKSNRSGANTQRSLEKPLRDSQGPVHRSTQSFLQPDEGPECEFCKRKKPEFANQDARDLHHFKDCLFLSACQYCEQVIDIPGMQEHWLTECEKKQELRKCQTCK